MDRESDPERAVIVLGASPKRTRFANKAVRAWRDAGYRIYPVHGAAMEVEGFPVYRRISDVPVQAATLLLYVRPEFSLPLIGEAPARGVRRVFLNPGTESEELEARIESLGMEPVEACAIVYLGRSPSEFAEQ